MWRRLMPVELLAYCDGLCYDGIKEKLTDRAAVSALRLYKDEPNKFNQFFKVDRSKELVEKGFGRDRKIFYQDVVCVRRIRDSLLLYDGRCFKKAEIKAKSEEIRERRKALKAKGLEGKLLNDNEELKSLAAELKRLKDGEILPDFTRGEPEYERVCVEVFTRVAANETEGPQELLDMFAKLFTINGGLSAQSQRELLEGLDLEMPDDGNLGKAPRRAAEMTSSRPKWR